MKRNILIKGLILIFAILVIFLMSRCSAFELVDTPKAYSISGFSELFEVTSSYEEEPCYLQTNDMEFCKVDDVYILPSIKSFYGDESRVWLRAYSYDETSDIRIENISLETEDGVLLLTEEDISIELDEKLEERYMLQLPRGGILSSYEPTFLTRKKIEAMYTGAFDSIRFEESEEWFYNGSRLKLNFRVSVYDGTDTVTRDMSYDVKVWSNKTFAMSYW